MEQIIIGRNLWFYEEEEAFAGVRRIAVKVREDIQMITGTMPGCIRKEELIDHGQDIDAVIYGTFDKSPVLEQLSREGRINLREIQGKREVFKFQLIEKPVTGIGKAILIAGSDKRGTIYGLFHLSELLGVSPLVNWSGVCPAKKPEMILYDSCQMVSKEPSVKYRGIFINDEWPAFGNWAMKNFGGINARCYEKVFELLLRNKGNYLWPAMWGSDFNLDGPGLESAILADELGVVMSTSHHEPCMRSGNEYGKVRGKASVYGDAWDFQSNREGILKFWEDGLKRNSQFENVITLGMRGENDTAIMQKASLAENIALLREVLREQNRLIREQVNKELHKVPRQIVLFTEVEAFFYGDENTPGLMEDPELEGVTLMLSDNNHGYNRTLPTEKMRDHKGGYGMYYHIDMHGGAHSYQWIGSTYLPKVWEQLSMAYDYGVRDIWVVNVGDIGTQEFALSYILELAYDMDMLGSTNPNNTRDFTEHWVRRQFGEGFEEQELMDIACILEKYTLMCERRKHEIMNEKIYHPVHFGEAEELLRNSEWIINRCNELKSRCPDFLASGFYELIFYPAVGTANLMKTWILAGRNEFYARQNRMEANLLAEKIENCLSYDKAITEILHTLDGGRFYGFGLSEHFGFTKWCEDDNKYPLKIYTVPANNPRIIVSKSDSGEYNIGKHWIGNHMRFQDFLRPDRDCFTLDIACGSEGPVWYRILSDCPWLRFSKTSGETCLKDTITVTVERSLLKGKEEGIFYVEGNDNARVIISVEAEQPDLSRYEPMTFLEYDGYIAMEADHYYNKGSVKGADFIRLAPYGRTGTAMKVYPADADFLKAQERPWLEYRFVAGNDGIYEACFYLAPSTPVDNRKFQYVGTSMNGETVSVENTVWNMDIPYFLSPQWSREAQDSVKLYHKKFNCRKGENTLRFYPVSPNIILERIVLHPEHVTLPQSYLGPLESFYCWK
ncbi:glycosyl hydrolase 115 family protein [Anaerocolumna sp. AGMB13020]|uniref:glycosyl hydrolase 115 family protein n=1 Tax=Anaerocolumna sp. AGMB13020 TaxID=3081750 RepID=UPI0029537967|nr:glycosyl hydrolase 115 family protein [Anaerocolumna sp. AGMB13020]WOO38254.1 glycosyl hydrolase 115 family protein [Anaerocolumna sp. AGMB13020]